MTVIEHGLTPPIDGHWEVRRARQLPPKLEGHVTYRTDNGRMVTMQFSSRTMRRMRQHIRLGYALALDDPQAKRLEEQR